MHVDPGAEFFIPKLRLTLFSAEIRSVAASVGLSVCLSGALWKTGESDPHAVWHRTSDVTPNISPETENTLISIVSRHCSLTASP